MRLTEWYPPHTKPVRVGVYNASLLGNPDVFRYWNGKYWSAPWLDCESSHEKRRCKAIKINTDDIHWRGLSAAPTPEE